MATTSIKQTIETIEDSITDYFSEEIKAVYFEKYTNTRKEKKFPQVSFYYADSGTNQNTNVNTIALEFEFLDVLSGLNDENDRRKEIVSDMFNTSSRVVSYLTDTKKLRIDTNYSVETFDKKHNGLGGVSFILNIELIKPCVS